MKKGHVPVRTCVACRRKRPAWEMIHLKARGDTAVILPARADLPGRGCYLCPREECISAALKKCSIQRALRKSSLVPPTKEEFFRWLE